MREVSARWAVAVLAATLWIPAAPAAAQTPASPLGTNLSLLREWTGEWPFVDAFKHSRPWLAGERFGCWDCAGPLDLDEQGWVRSLDTTRPNGGQVANTLLFNDALGRYPSGRYIVLYSGSGTLEYGGSATRDAAASTPGRDVVEVDATLGNFVLRLVATEVANPLRDIRVLMPGGACAGDLFAACRVDGECGGAACVPFEDTYATQPFHPTFLANLRPYRLVRFNNWMDVDGSTVQELTEWPGPDAARYWGKVPAELLAELANRLDADAWISLPVRASDDFASGFVCRLRARLEPGRKVWLEYGNEVWNGSHPFSMGTLWTAERGCERFADLAAGCDQDATPGNGIYCEGFPWPTANASCLTASRRYFSERSVELWNLAAARLGPGSPLVRVMASQSGNTGHHAALLGWNGAAAEADVLSVAPYFGFGYGLDAAVGGWTLDQLFADLATSATRGVPRAIAAMEIDADFLAANFPAVALVSYEGGQHLEGVGPNATDPAMNALFDAANRDPRMGTLYAQYLAAWPTAGGTLFTHFKNVSQWRPGRGGALEYQDQPHAESPKYGALMEHIEQHPCAWEGCATPAPEIFGDGFDCGDLARWQASAP